MEKNIFVNNVIFEMNSYIDYESIERLKNVLNSNLNNIELKENIMLPSVECFDNETMIKRYVVDMIASNREKTTINQYLRALRRFFDTLQNSHHEKQNLKEWFLSEKNS